MTVKGQKAVSFTVPCAYPPERAFVRTETGFDVDLGDVKLRIPDSQAARMRCRILEARSKCCKQFRIVLQFPLNGG